MSIIALPRPCWTYTCALDVHDTGRTEHATGPHTFLNDTEECDRPYELDSVCSYAICDGCGADYHHPGDDPADIWHFGDHGVAVDDLTDAGWTTNTAGE